MLALTILFDGIIYASWLFIVALGLTLVFGVLKILNIAHGSFYAVGAYVTASFVAWSAAWGLSPAWSLLAMVLAASAVALILAPFVERVLLRSFYGRDEVLLVLVTYALFLILEDVTKLIWGAVPYYVTEPYMLFGVMEMGPLSYVGYDFTLIAFAIVCGIGVWWGLNRTRTGKIVLAVIHSNEIAASMGINVARVCTWAFVFGVFLASLAGAMTAPMISVQPGLASGVIIVSFAVILSPILLIISGVGPINLIPCS